MVSKGFGADPKLRPVFCGSKGGEAAVGRLAGATRNTGPGIGLVIHPDLRIDECHVPVLLKMMERAFRRIDRQIGEVRTTEPLQLCVEIGKIASLQQWVIREVDAG